MGNCNRRNFSWKFYHINIWLQIFIPIVPVQTHIIIARNYRINEGFVAVSSRIMRDCYPFIMHLWCRVATGYARLPQVVVTRRHRLRQAATGHVFPQPFARRESTWASFYVTVPWLFPLIPLFPSIPVNSHLVWLLLYITLIIRILYFWFRRLQGRPGWLRLIDKVKFDNSPVSTAFLIDSNLTLTIPAPGPAAFKLSRDNMP